MYAPLRNLVGGALLVVTAVASGCDLTSAQYCADVTPNAAITDVVYDQSAERLYIAAVHSLSYCTGTDEKRYSNELIEVDLAAQKVNVNQRADNEPGLLKPPETGYSLYRDGNFTNTNCRGCELMLRTRDEPVYGIQFVTADTWTDEVISVYVTLADTLLVTIDIGGYISQQRN